MIRLISPTLELKEKALAYRQEHFDNGELIINGSELLDKTESYEEWLASVKANESPNTVSPTWVVTDTFFALDDEDEIVGIIDLRHTLNDFLKDFGNSGYSVRPSKRQRGYATEMLRQVLLVAKEAGLTEVHLSVERDNIPSVKTIVKNGGVYERSFEFEGEVADIYRIELWGEFMKAVPYTEDINKYLALDSVIDYEHEAIKKLSDALFAQAGDELAYIKTVYEFVRDRIAHSADAGENLITCSASEVLKAGHGICFAKSHLLAALLRCQSIPAGFCYQKLILDDETAPVLIYHGLVGVYIKELGAWVRLDARGNKEGVNAQFSIEKEQLAFPIRPELGEVDDYTVYPNPDEKVLERLLKYETRTQLWEDLPTELVYHMAVKNT